MGDNKKHIMQQTFKYIIVVDFEATCWDNKLENKKRDPEIIGKFLNSIKFSKNLT